MTGIPIIISAASGTGKTSLVNALLRRTTKNVVSISHTTRPKRSSEIDGVNYHFVTEVDFEKLIQANTFLEYARVFGNYYGTSKLWVEEQLAHGKNVIFEIDWQGARQIRQAFAYVVSIFILPPSLQTLKKRLQDRAQDQFDVIEKRMQQAKDEISHYGEFDYLVINDDFEKAVNDLQSIIRAAELNKASQQQDLKELLNSLL